MDQIKIGKFIADCRKNKGLTQQELADKLGLTAKAVSKWECGKGLPDVSLHESICEELGITLNEFFAGEHIEPNRIATQSDENLESILKDYYKLKNQKSSLIIILISLLIIVVMYLIGPMTILGIGVGLETLIAETHVQNDIREYNKRHYIEDFQGDLDSNLSIFPDSIDSTMNVLQFESSFTTGLFDTSGYLLLEYTLDEEAFAQEIARLSSLQMEINNYNGESYTNSVKYSEDLYFYPAYITIDGYTSTYEYALIDSENNRIICIYLTYVDESEFEHKKYLKLDRADYKSEDTIKKFSMYTHSFDGGGSYIEYDDYDE